MEHTYLLLVFGDIITYHRVWSSSALHPTHTCTILMTPLRKHQISWRLALETLMYCTEQLGPNVSGHLGVVVRYFACHFGNRSGAEDTCSHFRRGSEGKSVILRLGQKKPGLQRFPHVF